MIGRAIGAALRWLLGRTGSIGAWIFTKFGGVGVIEDLAVGAIASVLVKATGDPVALGNKIGEQVEAKGRDVAGEDVWEKKLEPRIEEVLTASVAYWKADAKP